MYTDVEQAQLMRPHVDLYIAGPPCQPWSSLGKHGGHHDGQGRGIIFLSILQYIQLVKPTVVLIENVRGLYDKHKVEMQDVLKRLSAAGYPVTWDILQSLDHGLPHSRPRVYVIGIQTNAISSKFTLPQRLRIRAHVDRFLDKATKQSKYHTFMTKTATANFRKAEVAFKKNDVDYNNKTCFVDLHASTTFAHWRADVLPCLTATRASQGGYYITNQRRMTTIHELGRLQGFTTSQVS
jgi:DNA-cytosine methyltransferase